MKENKKKGEKKVDGKPGVRCALQQQTELFGIAKKIDESKGFLHVKRSHNISNWGDRYFFRPSSEV